MKKKTILLLTVVLICFSALMGCDFSLSGKSDTDYKAYADYMPVFSNPGCVTSEKMTVSITNETEQFVIRYTLDGSEPGRYSSLYAGEQFSVPRAESVESEFDNYEDNVSVTMLRAAYFDQSGELVGKINSAVYIYTASADRFSLPIVSLVTNTDNLIGTTGIFANAGQSGSEWERPVFVQYFTENGELAISQDAGIRLFGGSSRGLSQKSLRITARKSSYFETSKYNGDGKFKYALFENRLDSEGNLLQVYDSFILRNGGNDSLLTTTEAGRATFLRDGIAHMIAEKAAPEVDNMNYKPVVVFINGEYYGILNMREHENDNNIADVYGFTEEEKSKICVIGSELDTSRGGRYDGKWFYYELKSGPESRLQTFEKMMKKIAGGEYTYLQVCEYIDVESFMKYCAVNLFTCNTDWPHNNVKVWCYCGNTGEGVRDGKWRFMFKDMDLGMGRYTCGMDGESPIELYTKADSQNFRLMLCNYIDYTNQDGYPSILNNSYPDSLYIQGVFAFLLKQEEFANAFFDYCEELATEIWPSEALVELIDSSAKHIDSEMKYYLSKDFGRFHFDFTQTYAGWVDAVYGETDSLTTWAKERPAEFLKQVNELKSILGY